MTLAIRAGDPLSKSSQCPNPPYFPLHFPLLPPLMRGGREPGAEGQNPGPEVRTN